MAQVKICPSKIPAVELRLLCSAIADAAEAYFSDPEHQRQFEEWQKERNKEDVCLKSK